MQNRHRHSHCREWRDGAFSLSVMGSGIVTKDSGALHPATGPTQRRGAALAGRSNPALAPGNRRRVGA
jgi:hypothetical protein